MSGIILYQSKYGATKRYADWLSEETEFDCIETRKAKIEDIKQYMPQSSSEVVSTPLVLRGCHFLKKHIKELRGKRIVVFCDGASPMKQTHLSRLSLIT